MTSQEPLSILSVRQGPEAADLALGTTVEKLPSRGPTYHCGPPYPGTFPHHNFEK